jgi:diguanylate cyclase (GGDEF)-like protein
MAFIFFIYGLSFFILGIVIYLYSRRGRFKLEELALERTKELKEANSRLIQEITERTNVEDSLSKSERFLGTIFDSIRDPFIIIDKNYRIVRANEAYAQLKRRPLGILSGRLCYEVIKGREGICDACLLEKTFSSGDPCAKEKPATLSDGSEGWIEIYTYPIFDEKGKVSHVIEYTRDITNRKRHEEERTSLIRKLDYLSKTDSLTGVLNRRAIMERIEYEIERAKRYGSGLSIVICDLDYFKEVNDTYGHAVGDGVLRSLTGTISGALRSADIAGRYGGDEFILILPETQIEVAEVVAERVREAVKEAEIRIGSEKINISLSLGVTAYEYPTDDADELIKRADSALYMSKNEGRNRVHVFKA